jgi:hypothetical protein
MMKTFMRIVEQADFDHNTAKLHDFGNQEFSTHGKANLKIRPNDPRFGDNPLAGANQPLEEFATDATIDRLHQMLNAIPITDQQIKGGVTLSQAGMAKAAARLGIGPDDVKMYINVLVQQLRDAENDDQEDQLLAEEYYNAVNTIDECDDKELDECDDEGKVERPFEVKEARYSYEPDALGSITIRDATTGKSKFIQGVAASKLRADLQGNSNHDVVLGALMEALDDAPTNSFMKEIDAQSGTYNFMWKANGQHGTGTAMFNADKPNLRLMDVRDAEGESVIMDAQMRQLILAQARNFIGKE